jgi:uncharacterized protein YciI
MKHWLLVYEAGPDYVNRRVPYRGAHLTAAHAAKARGELVLAGAFANPVDGTVLLFQAETAETAENFAKSDPYVLNGLIMSWRVREWTTVVGDLAMTPVAPPAPPAAAPPEAT